MVFRRFVLRKHRPVCAGPLIPVAIVLSATTAQLFSGTGPQLLMTGMFHGSEVAIEDGSTWLAVVPQGNHGLVVEEARVVVETVHDPIVDGDGETTGLLVSAPSCGQSPLFLVRGIDAIQTGPFDNSNRRDFLLTINETLTSSLSSRELYSLVVECGPNAPRSADNFVECPLVLTHERGEQVLASFDVWDPPDGKPVFAGEAAPRHLWSGDLDRDGMLDLLLDLSNHYNVSAPTLFLSSAAAEDELVGEVASLTLTGC